MMTPLPAPLAPASAVPSATSWAQRLIAAADGPVPQYGSDEWEALPDNSRVKVASALIAAECWKTYWEPAEHRRRLAFELDALREIDAREEWSPEVVASVHASANRLLNRPAPVDGQPRAGDYPGRNVVPLRRASNG